MKKNRWTKWVMGGLLLALCTLAPAQANGQTVIYSPALNSVIN